MCLFTSLDIKNSLAQCLENLDNVDLICIDDLDQFWAIEFGKKRYLCVLIILRKTIRKLVISANVHSAIIAIAVPDLQSRMASGIIFQIYALNDEQKITGIKMRAALLELRSPITLQFFCCNNYNRDTDIYLSYCIN